MRSFFAIATVVASLTGSLAQAMYPSSDYSGACGPCAPVCSPCDVPCCDNFDGWYIGATVGWGVLNHVLVDRDGFFDSFTEDFALGTIYSRNSGVIGGLEIGYNLQCGCTLLGIEADWTWADWRRSRTFTTPGGGDTFRVRDRHNWLGTIRARGGVVVDNTLLFLTAGTAYASLRSRTTVEDVEDGSESFRDGRGTRWGLSLGAGLEWAFSSCFTIKAEGLYFVFPERRTSFFSTIADDTFRFSHNVDGWMARVGFNWRLGGLFSCCS